MTARATPPPEPSSPEPSSSSSPPPSRATRHQNEIQKIKSNQIKSIQETDRNHTLSSVVCQRACGCTNHGPPRTHTFVTMNRATPRAKRRRMTSFVVVVAPLPTTSRDARASPTFGHPATSPYSTPSFPYTAHPRAGPWTFHSHTVYPIRLCVTQSQSRNHVTHGGFRRRVRRRCMYPLTMTNRERTRTGLCACVYPHAPDTR
jgi:hypothetical protein